MTSTPPVLAPPSSDSDPRDDVSQRRRELFSRLPDETSRRIKWQAQQLAFELPFPVADREDHQQDLMLALLKKLPQFDERRAGLRTFASQVIDSSASNQRRHYQASKRAGRTTSLESEPETPTVDELGRRQLAMDQQVCIDQLTPLQRQLCRYLGHHPEREIADAMGISRHAVRSEIRQIRRCFVRNDMAAYL